MTWGGVLVRRLTDSIGASPSVVIVSLDPPASVGLIALPLIPLALNSHVADHETVTTGSGKEVDYSQ